LRKVRYWIEFSSPSLRHCSLTNPGWGIEPINWQTLLMKHMNPWEVRARLEIYSFASSNHLSISFYFYCSN
jgi:hypothetical protein